MKKMRRTLLICPLWGKWIGAPSRRDVGGGPTCSDASSVEHLETNAGAAFAVDRGEVEGAGGDDEDQVHLGAQGDGVAGFRERGLGPHLAIVGHLRVLEQVHRIGN